MKEIVETIARALVDEPDVVSVTEVGGAHTSILALKVAKTDIGKVIGKQGRTAGAL
ncbi:MAG: KH domain-containing protein, partial [bacterium]|nr:KH domain-containing protein [bacterium]